MSKDFSVKIDRDEPLSLREWVFGILGIASALIGIALTSLVER